MTQNSAIGWTDDTFNPWWGCSRVSPACAHCYADAFAKRVGRPDLWAEGGNRRFFGDTHWNEPLKWNHQAETAGRPRFVFCASMADVFEDHPDLTDHRVRLWALIEQTPWLTWLLLTKRPENIRLLLPWPAAPANVWLGTSVENSRFTWRARAVQEVDAPVHFLSCEPLLGSLYLKGARHGRITHEAARQGRQAEVLLGQPEGPLHPPGPARLDGQAPLASPARAKAPLDLTGIEWVIGGGESGPGHRPFDIEWARQLRHDCGQRGIPFFWKQNGGQTPKAGGKALDGVEWCERPAPLSPADQRLFA